MATRVALGEVVEINPVTPPLIAAGERVAFIPMASVSETGSMKVTEHRLAGQLEGGYSYFRSGDVLLAKITPCFENNKITIAQIDTAHGFGSTEFHVIRPHIDALDPRYLVHFLRQDMVRENGARRMTGSAGQRRVPRQFLEELVVPVPPLNEQRRLAAILDQANELRRKRHLTLEKINAIPQAIFREMFGDVMEESYRNLGELIKVRSGQGLTRDKLVPGPFPVYGGNGVNGYHCEALVPEGTIVIGRVGVYCGAVHLTMRDAWVTDNALIVSIQRSDELLPLYLAAALENAGLNQYANRSSQPLISGSRLYTVTIPVPKMSMQRVFQSRISAAAKSAKSATRHLSLLDQLFASLQHLAFAGALIPSTAATTLALLRRDTQALTVKR